jgi:UDP-N-acetylglucosamine transferase subunit ALG13
LPATEFNIKILVAPLDWGLGHATRCIPLVKHLLSIGCTVVLAADGAQEKLLKLEFPELTIEHLEGYQINYAKNKRWFSFKIITQFPKILKAINKEHRWLKSIVTKHNINAIISDNRYGLWHPTLPVAFITHQLNIKTPVSWAEGLTRKYNYKFISRFSYCWVPDVEGYPNIAGELSHPKSLPAIPVKYLGGISRFGNQNVAEEFDALVVISGPEPQRTLLEQKILKELQSYHGKLLLIRGLPGNAEEITPINNTKIINHLPAKELALAFAKSKIIVSRSGYTTVMDILKLNKKSILIPTPGQTEQEYLAIHLQTQNWCMTVSQDEFDLQAALRAASKFPYQHSGIDMELYKEVLNDFIAEVNNR